MKLNLKNPMIGNIVMAAVGTAALAGFKKQFGIGDLVMAFSIILFILYFIDVFGKFTSFKAEKNAAKRIKKREESHQNK